MTDTTTTITMRDCTECWAVPGHAHIIDVIHPETGLTWIFSRDAATVQAQEPGAVRMQLDDWIAAKAEQQRTPIRWVQTDERSYQYMLEVLPPIDWDGEYFLVGEPHDHEADTGRPRYAAFGRFGGRYVTASRPITRQELRAVRR